MSMSPVFMSDDYSDGRTKQAFADESDINKLLVRAQKGDSLSHLAKHGAMYGDFSDVDDLLTSQARLARGQRIFDELPGEIKREFNQSAGAFYNFVNDPANRDDLARVLPGLAERGTQLPSVVRTPANVPADPVLAPVVTPDPAPDPAVPPEA